MRAYIVLLTSICLAGSAYAQTAPVNAAATSGVSAPAATPTIVNGKFVVGYEGRGDYLKNAALEKQAAPGMAAKAPMDTSLSKEMAHETTTAPAVPAAPAPTENATPKLRNDTSLMSDSTKLRATATPATTAATPAATTPAATATTGTTVPAPTPGAPNYNPMVLIGGKIQR